MKRKTSITFAIVAGLFFLISVPASAQMHKSQGISTGWNNREDDIKSKKDGKDPATKAIIIEKFTPIETWTDETCYYADVTMDSLWFVGVGKPIPAREALKMNQAYRLSMKLNNGKYIHVESLSNGKASPSDKLRALLLPADKYDYDSDNVWLKSEEAITNIYQYPSTDNTTKAIEVAGGADGEMIHTASFSKWNDRRTLIVYCDSQGKIVSLTNPESYLDGTIVIVDYLDNNEMRYTVTDIGGWPIKTLK